MRTQKKLNFSKEKLQVLHEASKYIGTRMQDEQQILTKLKKVGKAGMGLVTVTVNGLFEVLDIKLDPDLQKEDLSITTALIIEATNYAVLQVHDYIQKELFKIVDEVGLANAED